MGGGGPSRSSPYELNELVRNFQGEAGAAAVASVAGSCVTTSGVVTYACVTGVGALRNVVLNADLVAVFDAYFVLVV